MARKWSVRAGRPQPKAHSLRAWLERKQGVHTFLTALAEEMRAVEIMAIKREYRVELEKESLIFSAAHFITFGEDVCEALHGHNYRVRCRVAGLLNRHGYVVDFLALKDELQRLVKTLDHRTLLPTRHPRIAVVEEGREVVVRYGDRRWVFPAADCVLLPIDNTTAERLAEYLANQIADWLRAHDVMFTELTLAVDENEGQWGEIRLTC